MPEPVSYPGVYVEEVSSGATPVSGVPTSVAGFVDVFADGPFEDQVDVGSFAEFTARFGGLNPKSRAGYGILQFFENGGKRAHVVRVASVPGDLARGLRCLDGAASILCLPAMAGLATAPWVEVFTDVVGLCERTRRFLIVDPPADVTDIRSFHEMHLTGATANAAVYFPRLEITDPESGSRRETESSGTVAGIYARTDAAHGVWKAPAGTEASLIGARPTRNVDNALNDVLNPLGINALRTFPAHGSVAWGARTLLGADHLASEWKYVPVRRLALFLEKSIDRGTRWAVFEPNDQPLWVHLRMSVAAFLHALWRQGAFVGASPQEGFFVKCDTETTTQTDIANGRLNFLVGFAPLKPGEFVVLAFSLTMG